MASRLALNLRAGAICAALAAAAMIASAPAARAAASGSEAPATSIVPEGSGAATPAAAAPAAPKAAPKTKAPVRHKTTFNEGDVEPANARLKLLKDDWAFSGPSKWTKHVERVHAGKYIVVTGSTRYYLQVKLKSGTTAYVNQDAVDLMKPTDKIFQLTHNAAVLDKPNRWGKKVAEVHTPHSVHVVGVALSYVKIRMKSGREGFIPMTALQ
jgi:hypothetical protein